jgi:ABC-type Mn2+/Zn2+ transport system ATPase subunit
VTDENGTPQMNLKNIVEKDVERQLTVGYTPQQNGVSERKNQTMMEMAKSCYSRKGYLKNFVMKV